MREDIAWIPFEYVFLLCASRHTVLEWIVGNWAMCDNHHLGTGSLFHWDVLLLSITPVIVWMMV